MDWGQLTLFLYVAMRMTGFVVFSPILGRRGIPGFVKAGFTMVLAVCVISYGDVTTVAVPTSLVVLSLKLLLELALGYLLGFVMNLFFYIPALAGQIIDTQMGMSMASTYDAGSQISSTVTSTMLTVLMFLLFFAAGGHYTLLRLLLTSGQVVPFGEAVLGTQAAEAVAAIFIETILLSVKLSLPILAAELISEVGMGILMKTIPQINVFVINIELKVIVGLILVWLLMTPFTEFILQAEGVMLDVMGQILALAT